MTATNATSTLTVELVGGCLDRRSEGGRATEVYGTACGVFALVRNTGGGGVRLIRTYPRAEAAASANASLHGVNPIAVARAKVGR